jgi:hypothetical protein
MADLRRGVLLPISLAVLVAAGLAAWAGDGDSPKPALPRLKVNRSAAPRLSDAPKKEVLKSDGKPHADNTACFVCHGNYQDERLAQEHAAANVGCIKCHGVSTAHRNDEDHRTPPDIMYAAADIDRACDKCHETHDAPARKVLARWQEKCPAKTNPGELVCTDCHGEHRLKFRSYWWDKKTREFIAPKDGQRIKMAPDLRKREG